MKIPFKGNYICGSFDFSKMGKKHIKVSPGDLSDKVMEFYFDPLVVDEACHQGKKAFLPWLKTPKKQRLETLFKLKKIFQKRERELAYIISRETGKPLWESRGEVKSLSTKVDVTLKESLKLVRDKTVKNFKRQAVGDIRYKGHGLMAVIGPFNFPMHLPHGQILSALALGNSVLFKPSDKTPASGQLLAECYHRLNLPKGVFQMIQGDGKIASKLCRHKSVDGILFTGSFSVGQKIKKAVLKDYWKILALEMGGKNSAIIWDYTNLNQAVKEILKGCFLTAGQRCTSTSRVIVNKKVAKEFLPAFLKAAKKLSIGFWKDNPFMGPLIDQESLKRFLYHEEALKKKGVDILLKGRKPKGLKGWYVTPGLYKVSFDKKCPFQKEETFTPQTAIYEVDSLEEAIEIANHSGYGLALSLFSNNKQVREKVFYGTKTGLFYRNRSTCGASPHLPFGGQGRSGNNRPAGQFMVHSCGFPVALVEE